MNTTRMLPTGAAILAMAPMATAQDIELAIDQRELQREPLEITEPKYPHSDVRRGQEGWVRVQFVVTPQGQAVDPIIVDSVGGSAFEHSVREAMADWRFARSDQQVANNLMDVRFEIKGGRDRATSNFMRRYRRIVTHLNNDEFVEARKFVDQAVAVGGWNLYESTMLWLMHGRVEGAEGNDVGKLESYRRALRVSNSKTIDDDDRRDLLQKIFALEMGEAQYAQAAATLADLRAATGDAADAGELAPLIAELGSQLAASGPISAHATLFNPSDSDDGTPLWSYRPARPSFSFEALNGNVERFEVRCEHSRLQGLVEVGKSWQLPEAAGRCQVFVFGEDGATFQFVERERDIATGPQPVARSNGLD